MTTQTPSTQRVEAWDILRQFKYHGDTILRTKEELEDVHFKLQKHLLDEGFWERTWPGSEHDREDIRVRHFDIILNADVCRCAGACRLALPNELWYLHKDEDNENPCVWATGINRVYIDIRQVSKMQQKVVKCLEADQVTLKKFGGDVAAIRGSGSKDIIWYKSMDDIDIAIQIHTSWLVLLKNNCNTLFEAYQKLTDKKPLEENHLDGSG
uniref:Uncharacterized protein n=1 Tax=Bionectria ochroleuca TaxID=29856 RepID=A0A8H7K5J5_BIOOC